jgi:hypothetical protein
MEPIVFKKRPVTKTTKTYTPRFDVDVDAEDKPKVEKRCKRLSESAERLAVQTTLSAYKRTVATYRAHGQWAPFMDDIAELEAYQP